MGTELASYLVTHHKITADEANDLLQRMVLQGGSFDTNLLENDLLDEATCLQAMQETFALQVATKKDIDDTPPEVAITFPLLFAQMHNLVPHRFQNGYLVVLATTPPQPEEMQNLIRRLGVKVVVRLTLEARIHYALNKMYGLEISPRFTALLSKLDGKKASRGSIARMKAVWSLVHKPIPEQAITIGAETRIDAATIRKELLKAGDRDTVIDLLLQATLTNFNFVALFTVVRDAICGWACKGGSGDENIQAVTTDLQQVSMLQTVVLTESPYLGRIPKTEANKNLLEAMGRSWPTAAFLAPLRVSGKVIAVLYGDTSIRKLSNESVKDLLVILAAASHGLENVIRSNKRQLQQELLNKEAGATGDSALETTTTAESAMAPSATAQGASAAVKQLQALQTALEEEDNDDDGWDDMDVDAAAITSLPGAEEEEAPVSPLNMENEEQPEANTEAPENCRGPELLAKWREVVTAIRSEKPFATTTDNTTPAVPAAAPVDLAQQQLATAREDLQQLLQPQIDRFVFQQIVAQLSSLPDDILLPELIAVFPGQLAVDPFKPGVRLPVPEELSAILALLVQLGERSAPVIAAGLEHGEPRYRFVAAFLLSRIYLPAMVDRLGALLYDNEAKVRFAAAYSMRRYNQTTEYEEVLTFVRQQLNQADVPQQLSAIQLIQQLRDQKSVPALIDTMLSGSATLITATTAALLTITGQAYGNNIEAWQNWWQAKRNSPREYWLLEGMMHQDATVRHIANMELMAITGFNAGFNAKDPEASRIAALHRWQAYFSQKK